MGEGGRSIIKDNPKSMRPYMPFHLHQIQIPALMAKCSVPSDTALIQSSRALAFFGKILLLQTIAVLCTDSRIQ